jgi:phosphoheptose isomerase
MLPLSEKTEINALQQISRHIVTGLKDGNKVMPLPRQASKAKSHLKRQFTLPKI